ncbi:MAG: ATP-binding protein [Myxococcota bacterium]
MWEILDVIDDFGLRKLSGDASIDLYEVLIARHKRASTIVTSNRTVDEWIALFDDPILAQSCLDRLAHNAHQVIIEGDSYRKRQGRQRGARRLLQGAGRKSSQTHETAEPHEVGSRC